MTALINSLSRRFPEPSLSSVAGPAAALATIDARGTGEWNAHDAQALVAIIQEINQSLEADRVFALVAQHAAALLGARSAWLGMLDGDTFTIVAGVGVADRVIGERVPVSATFGGECIRSQRPVRTFELPAGPPGLWRSSFAALARRNAVAAPLLVGVRPIGAITVVGNEARDFDEHDELLLLALANHAAVAVENARLYRAAVHMMRHANILATAARSLAQNTTARAMYADIARLAHTSLGADGTTIFLADPSSRSAELVYADGVAAVGIRSITEDFWHTPGGRATINAVAEFRSDVRDFQHEPAVDLLIAHNVASAAILPLIVEGRPRGMLGLRFVARQAFDAEQRQLLCDFGTHVALALRNALQLETLEQRAGRLAAVAKVQQTISAATSLGEVYAEIYRAVASVVDARRFMLLRFDPEHGVLAPEYVVRDGQPVNCHQLSSMLLDDETTGQAVRWRQAAVAARLRPDGAGPVPTSDDADPLTVVLAAPIEYGDQVLGVLQAQSDRQDAYDWDDIDVITLIAQQAGTAIARARAYEAEQRQHMRERMLATALEAMEQPVFICSTRSLIQYANGAATREFGYAPEEFIGMHERQLGIDGAAESRAALHSAMVTTGVWTGELVQRRKDGDLFPAWVTMSAIRDDEGHPAGVVVILRNLTEERRVAEQLRQSDKLAALGELVAGVVHEMNNPLTGISVFAQLLQNSHLDAEQREGVQMIKREADRAVMVVRDLLTFARKTGPRSVPVDINALIEQTLRLRTYGIRSGGIEVELHLASDLRIIQGDDRQLQQVLLNLILNAEHAMALAPDRRLTIRTENAPNHVVIEVADTGCGMTADVQQRIFEPFFTTKGDGNGTGLGLSVSYGIVRSHGGMLTARSAPGAGATFRVVLPFERPEPAGWPERIG